MKEKNILFLIYLQCLLFSICLPIKTKENFPKIIDQRYNATKKSINRNRKESVLKVCKQNKQKNKKLQKINQPLNDVDERPDFFDYGMNTLSSCAKFALKVSKGTIKKAVNLVTAKHVAFNQIIGKWRLYQDIEIGKGNIVSYPVSIQLLSNGTIMSYFENDAMKSAFAFKERKWPKRCSIEFQIKSFKAPHRSQGEQEQPVSMLYKGYFKRSVLNPKLIFMRGKIYKISGKSL
jgi:hypothetical protein